MISNDLAIQKRHRGFMTVSFVIEMMSEVKRCHRHDDWPLCTYGTSGAYRENKKRHVAGCNGAIGASMSRSCHIGMPLYGDMWCRFSHSLIRKITHSLIQSLTHARFSGMFKALNFHCGSLQQRLGIPDSHIANAERLLKLHFFLQVEGHSLSACLRYACERKRRRRLAPAIQVPSS